MILFSKRLYFIYFLKFLIYCILSPLCLIQLLLLMQRNGTIAPQGNGANCANNSLTFTSSVACVCVFFSSPA